MRISQQLWCRGILGEGTQRLPVLLVDCGVALAGAVPQTFHVQYFYPSARVLYHSSFLKGMRNGGHACPPDAKHFSQKFLGKRQMITSRQIAGAQQPAAKPG